ncbi:MAG: DnaJ domain-containing protein [Candidatus Riflebacteria bacterium]|nr:DnaJ domain-containing protein [Candidatus Riflebacteria bacterium]
MDSRLFATEVIGFILGRGEARAAGATNRTLLPLDRLGPGLVFQPKTRQGFLRFGAVEREVCRFGIQGMSIGFQARIHGFRHKRGTHLLAALDRRTGRVLGGAIPIYADTAGNFLIRKDFITMIGTSTDLNETFFVPNGSLAGSPEGLAPYFCLFTLIDDHPEILFSEGLPVEVPELFADVWAPLAPRSEPMDELDPFEAAVVGLTSAVILVDGVIKTDEIQVVRKFFAHAFQGRPGKMGNMRQHLKRCLADLPDLEAIQDFLARRPAAERRMIIALLLNIASADGELETSELTLIDGIRRRFGIPDDEFGKMTADFQPEDFPFFKALGVAPGAGWAEVKEAHRKKSAEYHPDLYPNLPESFREFARREYQRVQEAFRALAAKFGQPAG